MSSGIAGTCEVDVFEGFEECDRTSSIRRDDVLLCGEHAEQIAAWCPAGRANTGTNQPGGWASVERGEL